MDIKWFPGHMAKAGRLIKENIKQADVVIEVADARIPLSSTDTENRLKIPKTKLVALNKADLADPAVNSRWIAYFNTRGIKAFLVDSLKIKGVYDILAQAKKEIEESFKRQEAKGRIDRAVRIMVIGIPNSGKSTFINSVVNKKAAATGDRPGVTKNSQWIRINKDFIMLDMPGILQPNINKESTALNLALTGAIKKDPAEAHDLAAKLIGILRRSGTGRLEKRYGIAYGEEDTDPDIIKKIAFKRGFLIRGGEADSERCSIMLLDEFRAGKLGRLSLEEPAEDG